MSPQTESPGPQPAQSQQKGAISDDPSQKDSPTIDTEDSKQVANLPKTSQGSHPGELPTNPGTNSRKPQGEQQPAPNPQGETSSSGAPSVKLDMDLDIEVELKAKIQGDLELAILDGK